MFMTVYFWSWKLNLHFNSLGFTARDASSGGGGRGEGVERDSGLGGRCEGMTSEDGGAWVVGSDGAWPQDSWACCVGGT